MRKRNDESALITIGNHHWRLTKLKSGVFQAVGRKVHPSVKRKSLNTRDPKVALERLKDLDRMVRQELVFGVGAIGKNAGPIELNAGVEEYLKYVGRARVAKGCKEGIVQNYRNKLTVAVAEFRTWGLTQWQQIGLTELYKYAEVLDRRGLAIRTQGNTLVIVKQVINHFLEQKRLPASSDFKLEIDKVRDSTAYCYTDSQVIAMIEHCYRTPGYDWLGNVIVALAETGLRIGELAQLRWPAVNLAKGEHGFLQIVDESRTVRGPEARSTKGRKSRQLPITKDLRVVLDRLASRCAEGRVFRAERGGQLHERNVLQAFIDKVNEPLKEQFPELDVNEKSFADGRLHSFRHYFCSRCANQGVSERVVMQWLGHTSSTMIARYYHLHDDEAQRQIGKLGSLMNRPAT